MDFRFLSKYMPLIVLAYLNLCVRTFVCRYRKPYSDSYSYGRPERHSRISRHDYNDQDYYWDQDYAPPQRQYKSRDKWSDYDSDYRTEYRRGYPYPDRGITSFNSGVFPRKMMKISDLNDLPKSHPKSSGKRGRLPKTEERVEDDSPIMARTSRRTRKDGLGKSMSAEDCGISSDLTERIVGGTDATEGAHPWIVAILKDGEAWCGGSIIAPQWILTAAHCFMGDEPEQSTWAIRVGTINRNQGRTYKVKKVITHERFNLDNMLNSDIALMMITKPIQYTKNIHPVCLPDNSYDEPVKSKVIIAGWGATKFDDENLPVILQDVSLTVVKDGECAKKYRQKKYTLYKSQFCTWNYKKDACQGDSGGPAVEIANERATLVGVVSYGSTCADDFPGVYTQVSYFLTWISKTIKGNPT